MLSASGSSQDKSTEKKPMKQRSYLLNITLLRRLLLAADDILHFIVAAMLMICAALVLIQAVPEFLHPTLPAILHILNDVLLSLIVMELMWPVVRFLKRESFSLNPFIYIGIISSTRRILMIEAEHSTLSTVGRGVEQWPQLWPYLAELGVNVIIILALITALRILPQKKTDQQRHQ